MNKIKTVVGIDGMSCKHCASKVSDALKSIDGISSVKVNLKNGEAIIQSNTTLDKDKIIQVIEDLGYKVKGVN